MHLWLIELMIVLLIDNRFDPVVPGLLLRTPRRLQHIFSVMISSESLSTADIAHRVSMDDFLVHWVHIAALTTVERLMMLLMDGHLHLEVHRIRIKIAVSLSRYI